MLRASFVASMVFLAACGDDSGGATSVGGGSASSLGSAQGGGSSQGNGGEDGAGGSASPSSSTSTTQSGPTSSASTATSGSTSSGSCVPQCDGKVCGDDTCGGSCGGCEGELVCSNAGECITVDPGSMSFFVTSVGNLTGDYGGLEGADAFCQSLADGAGSVREWHAYVSTASVDARDRIGSGPWFDATGSMVAASVAALHEDGLFYDNARDEHGQLVPNGKTAPGANEHDVLTGSTTDGTFSGASCDDWTSSSPGAAATTGHCDASFTEAGGPSPVEPSDNWNSSHDTSGCDETGLNVTGSTARLYCFAD